MSARDIRRHVSLIEGIMKGSPVETSRLDEMRLNVDRVASAIFQAAAAASRAPGQAGGPTILRMRDRTGQYVQGAAEILGTDPATIKKWLDSMNSKVLEISRDLSNETVDRPGDTTELDNYVARKLGCEEHSAAMSFVMGHFLPAYNQLLATWTHSR